MFSLSSDHSNSWGNAAKDWNVDIRVLKMMGSLNMKQNINFTQRLSLLACANSEA